MQPTRPDRCQNPSGTNLLCAEPLFCGYTLRNVAAQSWQRPRSALERIRPVSDQRCHLVQRRALLGHVRCAERRPREHQLPIHSQGPGAHSPRRPVEGQVRERASSRATLIDRRTKNLHGSGFPRPGRLCTRRDCARETAGEESLEHNGSQFTAFAAPDARTRRDQRRRGPHEDRIARPWSDAMS